MSDNVTDHNAEGCCGIDMQEDPLQAQLVATTRDRNAGTVALISRDQPVVATSDGRARNDLEDVLVCYLEFHPCNDWSVALHWTRACTGWSKVVTFASLASYGDVIENLVLALWGCLFFS